MLLILPISRIDSGLALRLAKWISTLGGGANHHLLVSCPANEQSIAEEIQNILKSTFASTAIYVLDQEHELGWPSSANFMFKKTAGYVYARGNRLPFYWFEADNVPMKSSWLDDLQTEYNLAQKPFMGVIEDSFVRDPNTKEVVRKDGQHMNGSGIYPANFVRTSQLFDSIHTHKEAQPWDLYFRWEMKGHIHNSKQMINNWKTKEYVRTSDGMIACTSIYVDHPPKYVTEAIAVVHGCKDESLIDLLETKVAKPSKKSK
jgi:hypothetical protein